MAIWVIRQTFTDQGRQQLAQLPARLREIYAQLDELGFTVHGAYFTTGDTDLLVILEAPSDEEALAVIAGANMRGAVVTNSVRAFTIDEFEQIVGGDAAKIS